MYRHSASKRRGCVRYPGERFARYVCRPVRSYELASVCPALDPRGGAVSRHARELGLL